MVLVPLLMVMPESVLSKQLVLDLLPVAHHLELDSFIQDLLVLHLAKF
jgi:hypothetical protein